MDLTLTRGVAGSRGVLLLNGGVAVTSAGEWALREGDLEIGVRGVGLRDLQGLRKAGKKPPIPQLLGAPIEPPRHAAIDASRSPQLVDQPARACAGP